MSTGPRLYIGSTSPTPWLGYATNLLLYPIKKTPEQSCISTTFAITAVQAAGLYFTPPAWSSRDTAMDPEGTNVKQRGCPVTTLLIKCVSLSANSLLGSV